MATDPITDPVAAPADSGRGVMQRNFHESVNATTPSATPQEIAALESILRAAEDERATTGRWSYFTLGGWGGDRLICLLNRLKSAGVSPSEGSAPDTKRNVPSLLQNEDVRMLHELANALLANVYALDPYRPHRYSDFLRDLATRLPVNLPPSAPDTTPSDADDLLTFLDDTFSGGHEIRFCVTHEPIRESERTEERDGATVVWVDEPPCVNEFGDSARRHECLSDALRAWYRRDGVSPLEGRAPDTRTVPGDGGQREWWIRDRVGSWLGPHASRADAQSQALYYDAHQDSQRMGPHRVVQVDR